MNQDFGADDGLCFNRMPSPETLTHGQKLHWLNECIEQAAVKVRHLYMIAEFFDTQSAKLKLDIKRLAEQRDLLVTLLRKTTGVKTFPLPCGTTVSTREAGAKITVVDAGLVPEEFKRQPPTPEPVPDLEKIKKHYKETGEIIAGIEVDTTKEFNVSVDLEAVKLAGSERETA